MRYGINFAQNGRPLPPMIHVPATYHNLPYVPNVHMVLGMHPIIPVLGQPMPVAGVGNAVSTMVLLNSKNG